MFGRPHARVAILLALELACGSDTRSDGVPDASSNRGGVIAFAEGSERVGPVPTDGTSAKGPVIVSLTSPDPRVEEPDPLRLEIAYTDPDGDLTTVYFGILGEATHYEQNVEVDSGETEGTLSFDLHPRAYVVGKYSVAVSLADSQGNVSRATSLDFMIETRTGAGGSAGSGTGTGGASGTWSVRVVNGSTCNESDGEFVVGGGGECEDVAGKASVCAPTVGRASQYPGENDVPIGWDFQCRGASTKSLWTVCAKAKYAAFTARQNFAALDASIPCTSDRVVVGGGCLCDGGHLLESRPDANGWYCACDAEPVYMYSYGWAICLSVANDAEFGPVAANGECALGESALGGGCVSADGFRRLGPEATRWQCEEGTAQAICARLP